MIDAGRYGNVDHRTGSRLNRRQAMKALGAVPLALGLGTMPRPFARTASAAARTEGVIASELGLPPEMAPPPDLGQTTIAAYVPATGHTVRGLLLEYWRATGAASTYGNPITEPFVSPDGYYSQAFENGVLQYRPEFRWTDDPFCRLMPIGQMALTGRTDAFRQDGRRHGGGGDPRASIWRPVDPNGQSVANALGKGGRYFAESGHTL